jgi:hypothetical protein
MLVLVFGAAGLGWLPVVGLHDQDATSLAPGERLLDLARHAILPVRDAHAADARVPLAPGEGRDGRSARVRVRAARRVLRGLPEGAVVRWSRACGTRCCR